MKEKELTKQIANELDFEVQELDELFEDTEKVIKNVSKLRTQYLFKFYYIVPELLFAALSKAESIKTQLAIISSLTKILHVAKLPLGEGMLNKDKVIDLVNSAKTHKMLDSTGEDKNEEGARKKFAIIRND